MNSKDISLVIPIYNEEGTLHSLFNRLVSILEKTGKDYEILFVNDGSTDGSLAVMNELCNDNKTLRIVKFRKNMGKSAALYAGFGRARGEVVITIDADLQEDPDEIPRFLSTIEEGYDLVSGWRNMRQDPISKTLPSKIFNVVTAIVTGIEIHDFNCGFKAYRKKIIREMIRRRGLRNVILYGELHRYFPALVARHGYRITEIPVYHRPRMHGKSKYGLKRFFWGLWGLFAVMYSHRKIRKK